MNKFHFESWGSLSIIIRASPGYMTFSTFHPIQNFFALQADEITVNVTCDFCSVICLCPQIPYVDSSGTLTPGRYHTSRHQPMGKQESESWTWIDTTWFAKASFGQSPWEVWGTFCAEKRNVSLQGSLWSNGGQFYSTFNISSCFIPFFHSFLLSLACPLQK